MQREEKQLELTIEAVLNRLNDLKMAIGGMVHRLETEYETINWTTFLDNLALISSHLTGLSKILSKDHCPPLRNRTLLPLIITQERDEVLSTLTEGRLPVFAHDIVPDYLRTKPDPLAEKKMIQHEQKAANISVETAMKQVTQYNKVILHVLDMVNKAREEWEIESSSRPGIQQTSSMADTHALAAAVGNGKGLKNIQMAMPGGSPGSGIMMPSQIRVSNPISPNNPNQLNKPPAGIKTNIKSAMQIHPFSR